MPTIIPRCHHCGRILPMGRSTIDCRRRECVDKRTTEGIGMVNAYTLSNGMLLFARRSVVYLAALMCGTCSSNYNVDCESDAGRHFSLCLTDATAGGTNQPTR